MTSTRSSNRNIFEHSSECITKQSSVQFGGWLDFPDCQLHNVLSGCPWADHSSDRESSHWQHSGTGGKCHLHNIKKWYSASPGTFATTHEIRIFVPFRIFLSSATFHNVHHFSSGLTIATFSRWHQKVSELLLLIGVQVWTRSRITTMYYTAREQSWPWYAIRSGCLVGRHTLRSSG